MQVDLFQKFLEIRVESSFGKVDVHLARGVKFY